jgi:hypothetical protein
MLSSPKYLELRIDVFDRPNQRAQVLAELKPRELVNAILEEFGDELDYLSADPGVYWLRKARENERLDERQSLAELVRSGDHLVLEEVEPDLPARAQRPSRPIYLQDGATQHAYKLPWLPAIIGRQDPELPEDDLVAVDLSTNSAGSRVSRRHLRIWEENGEYFVQAASANPATLVRDKDGEIPVPSGNGRERLLPLDIIRLDRSQITLKFIAREG